MAESWRGVNPSEAHMLEAAGLRMEVGIEGAPYHVPPWLAVLVKAHGPFVHLISPSGIRWRRRWLRRVSANQEALVAAYRLGGRKALLAVYDTLEGAGG